MAHLYINKEELHTIYNYDLNDSPHLDRQRDIFVFQCCIGCRVGDLVRLTKADIINGAVEYIASKTIEENQKTILVSLNKTALAILEKYKDYEGPKLLPFITQPKYNDAIKEIFTRAGITRNVTYLNPLTEREEKVPIILLPPATWSEELLSAICTSRYLTRTSLHQCPATPRAAVLSVATAR